MDTEKKNENTEQQEQAQAVDPWHMAGTEKTGQYVVVARSALGRVGYRWLGCNFRVRVEPADEAASALLAEKFVGWKQPDQFGGLRYSTMGQGGVELVAELLVCVKYALDAFTNGGVPTPLEVNPAAPPWAHQLVNGATPGDVLAAAGDGAMLGLPSEQPTLPITAGSEEDNDELGYDDNLFDDDFGNGLDEDDPEDGNY